MQWHPFADVAIAWLSPMVLVEKRLWARITLVVLMVPIAVASNALRVVGGYRYYFWGPQYAEVFFHSFKAGSFFSLPSLA